MDAHRVRLALRKTIAVAIGDKPSDASWARGIDYILSIEEPASPYHGDAQVLCICEPDLHVTPLGAGLMLVSGDANVLLSWAASGALGAAGYLVVCVDGAGRDEPGIQVALDAIYSVLVDRGVVQETLLCFDATDRLVRWEVKTDLFADQPSVDVTFELL